ncbi:MAG TPA: Uma2 family endonuclease, partial [Caulobacteraceae bacterium]|nr:Uma2 family endonuclease [Caulobacteraceae bacterium]
MSLALKLPMTLAEFLVWEEQQPLRYEFDGTAPVAMTGGSAGHASIRANLAAALLNRLRGSPCRFYRADFKLQVASGHIRYADGMVVSHPVDRSATLIGDPVVVLEVLSPSAAREDRIVKAREYQATPSVQ